MKNMSKSTGYLIVIGFWLIVLTLMSSCYTIQEMTGNDRTKNLRCTQVSR